MPEDAVLRVRTPLTGYASLKQNILHNFIYLIRSCWREAAQIFYTATLQQANFITRLFTRYIDELNSLSAIRALSYFRSSQSQQQSSESRKIRGEADAISTQRP